MPTVSVVIPTYNRPALLLETLASVYAQTFTDYEIIVVNDGSTDDTVAQLESHRDRIRLITQENQGIGAARNRGIREATGEFVALLDHDDIWLPEKLETQVQFMREHPDASACSVPWAYLHTPEKCVSDPDKICNAEGIVERPLAALADGQVFLISSSIMFRRSVADGLFYETFRNCIEDTPFQIGLFARGEFGIAGVGKILMRYRWHGENYSANGDFFDNGIRMLRRLDREGRFSRLSAIDKADLSEFLAHVGRNGIVRQLLAGRRWKASSLFVRELPFQLGVRRFRFVLSIPFLTMLSNRRVKRKFGS